LTLSVYVIEDRADQAARFLEAAVDARLNVLVADGTQAGNPATH
jgi:Flp pilus assembly CpaF family ATPase